MLTALDTQPHELFHTYSAGNFTEVAPSRLSPFSWSVVGEPVEAGCRALVSRLWPRATWHTGSGYVFVGYFSCRPYHNLSAFCHLADMLPLLAPTDVTECYFEAVPTPERHAGLRPPRADRWRAPERMMTELVSLRGRLREADGLLAAIEDKAERRAGRPLELVAAALEARDLLPLIWGLHYSTTFAVVPLQSAQRRLGRRMADHWSELELLLNRPRELVWSALAEGQADFLRRAFYEVADDRAPWDRFVRPAGASVAGPPRAIAAELGLDQLVWDMYPRHRRLGLAELTRAVSESLEFREHSKSLAMRLLHVVRGLAPRVADLQGIGQDDWPLLSLGELLGDVAPARLAERAASRAEVAERALTAQLPDVLDFSRGDDAFRARAGATAGARGVSAGTVSGVAVDRTLQHGGSGEQRILVCESADADIQPLLPHLGGVIVARGSLLSHIAILTREYSVPAVVGYADIDRLVPGTRVSIDGTTGEVRIEQ